jgi:hypothetical protein
MPDSKITALASTGTGTDPANDPLVIVDVSDTSMAATGTTKKVTLNNLLACSPTATLASATISGDLTVRSGNKLILNRADNAISTQLNDAGSGAGFTVNNLNGDGILFKVAGNNVYQIGSAYVQTWFDGAGGTRMTLNSTGLAIGDTAFAGTRLTLRESASQPNALAMTNRNATQTWRLSVDTAAVDDKILGFYDSTSATFRMQLTDTGNLGVGVTPSAWVSTYKALQASTYASFAGNSDDKLTAVSNNFYNDGTGKFVGNGYAASYSQYQGAHRWQTSTVSNASGAGAGLTFNMNMTLDASGYLLIGTTDNTFTSGAGYKFGPGATPSNGQVGASSSNGDLTLRVYSTGAAAYRFYVGYGGTVFATTTAISAISDARLKENVKDIDVGLSAILALKPRTFDWKAGKGKDIKGDRGFIAQEFEAVFPNLIDEWADPAPEGEAPYKSVRQDLIPVLVKAIQELTARVQTIEAR